MQSLAPFLLEALWLVVLRLRDGTSIWRAPRALAIQRNHVLPATLQATIYAYWMVYSPDARVHLILVAQHIAFGILFELLLTYTRERHWRLTLSAVPAAVSLNLFVWYVDASTWVGFLILAGGLAAKPYIRWRGKHLFNPSALAIAFGAFASFIVPSVFRFHDVSGDFSEGPNMLELVFLVSLIPLVLVRTASVTVGAFFALLVCHGFHLTPVNAPESFFLHLPDGRTPPLPFALWAPWLLAITLFAGDPATVPRSTIGRLLNGAVVGFGLVGFAFVLYRWVSSDFFAKALAVVFANALVPLEDRIGERVARELPVVESPRLNWAWVGTYASLLVVGIMGPYKELMFRTNLSHRSSVPVFWKLEDGRLSEETRRIYATPFSFLDEGRAWAARDRRELGEAGRRDRIRVPRDG